MLMFILLFGFLTLCAGGYIAYDNNRTRKEKLAKIQRKLARREAAEAAKEAAPPARVDRHE